MRDSGYGSGELTDFTRFEVIDETGRVLVRDNCDEKLNIEIVTQDDGRTMKVFVTPREGRE